MKYSIYGKEFGEAAHEFLARADKVAYEGVLKGHGPFSAGFALFDKKTGKFETIGKIAVNAVVNTGDPGAHGEDQALKPENIRILIDALRERKDKGWDPVVVFASSGQSCQACHAKEEIVARHLVALGLIKSGDFVVVYGNTFKQTKENTGFNDLPYVADLLHNDLYPNTASMVRESRQPLFSVPAAIAEYFKNANQGIAVIAKDNGNQILAVGRDLRHEYDPLSNPAIAAIREAGAFRKRSGANMPFQIGDPNHAAPDVSYAATMYTNFLIGAAARGVSQWGAINKIMAVSNEHNHIRTVREAGDLNNDRLRHLVAQGYRQEPNSWIARTTDWIKYELGHMTAMTVFHDRRFEDTAQHAWADLQAVRYNGANSSGIPAFYQNLCETRFSGVGLGCN